MKLSLVEIFFAVLILISCDSYAQSNYTWRGGVSSDWSNASNWRIGSTTPTTAPGTLDNVFIGVSTTLFTNQPQINSGYTANVASVTMGAQKTVNLVVNGTLNVSGDLVQRHSDAGLNITPTLTGTGTVNCYNLGVGSTVAPPLPFLGLTTQTYTTLLSSSVAHLNLTNNLNLNSTSSTATLIFIVNYNVNNPYFYLEGGDMVIGNSIATTNSAYVSTSSLKNLAEFYIMSNTSAATLTLNGATPFAFDANGAGGADFYNSGTYSSTVIYNYSGSGTQTVYSNGQSRFGVLPASYQYVQFANSGAKSIQSGTMSVWADWTSNGGKIDAVTNNTTVSFQGTTQSITDNGSDSPNGMTFKNVIFTGGGTKTFTSGNFNVASTGLLTMASSSTLNANGNLTLFSDASSSAAVAVIPTGSSITNNVNVQRYLVGGNTKTSGVYTARGYRMLSSPVNSAGTGYIPFNYIGNTALTGGPGTGFTVTNTNPTLYLFREDVAPSNTTFNSGRHKGILSISGTTVSVSGSGSLQVPVGNGYIFYFVGNTTNTTAKTVPPFTAGPENTIITTTGRLNQGDIAVNLWYTPAGATGTTTNKLSYQSSLGTLAGHNMVGNPYASTLDLDKVITDNTASIGTTVYELDNVNPNQKYIAYNKGGSSDPKATQYVVSGQGFMVKAKAANGSLTFHESEKVPAQQVVSPNLLMGMPVATQLAVTGFYMKLERDSVVDDYCGIYFSPNASPGYDDDDAQDLDGASAQVYMSSLSADGVRTAINRMPTFNKASAPIKLYVNAKTDGLYKLKIEDIRNIDTLYDIWLKDKLQKDSLDIRRYKSYEFRINRADTNTYGANRFELVLRRRPLADYQLIALSGEKINEGIKVTWKVYNEGNYTGFSLQKLLPAGSEQYSGIYSTQSNGGTTYSFIDQDPLPGTNVYRLQQNDINEQITYSQPITVQVNTPGTNSPFSVYPNPTTGPINIKMNAGDGTTSYTAKIYNYSGALMMQKTMQNGNWSQSVGNLMPGTYIIELSKGSGEYVGRSKFVKH